ncbi:hypothetical protein CKK33_11665 [Mucilaginibacter sp. MD40]|uniref:hypothetical protein n=1 Tax=Mucilaginibacter sp. MD40 TaxID=2029590 RepID=UPI000BAC5BC1|nr:hypothetical protein [Mucilaginibacter sp. MD40]PAW94116.1 hypothetical protein CKK33_11665 [Mucilaginibacter sp. MD40]
MLRIDIPQNGEPAFTYAAFEQYNIPLPANGTDTEVNGDVILLFEDEQEAVEYLDILEDYATGLDNNATQKPLVNALVSAISNDEFVQAYLR